MKTELLCGKALAILLTFCLLAPAARSDPAENRQPECQREAAVYDNLNYMLGVRKVPIGPVIVRAADMRDPRYPGSEGWEKYEFTEYQNDWSRANEATEQEYKYVIHYLFNKVTGAWAQMKLKNSYQEGCTGKTIPRRTANSGSGGSNSGGDGESGSRDGTNACSAGSVTRENTWVRWEACGGGSCETGSGYVGGDIISMEAGSCG